MDFENFDDVPPIRWQDKIRFKFNDWANSTDEQVRKRWVKAYAVVGSVVLTATVLFPPHETQRERVQHTYQEFNNCLARSLNFQEQEDIDLTIAFPDFPLSAKTTRVLEQCREAHPMPQ